MHGGNVWAGYTSARRRLLGIGLVLGLVFISACSAATGASNAALAGSGGDAFRAFVITDDGGAPYDLSGTVESMQITPGERGGNRRIVFAPKHGSVVQDSEACVVITKRTGGITQPGLAFRVRSESDGTVQAITVTQNVTFGFFIYLNVHVWDSSKQTPQHGIGRLDFGSVLLDGHELTPYPWQVCARLRGRTMEVRVWTEGGEPPAWGVAPYTHSLDLPADAVAKGRTGLYIGHLTGDAVVGYDDFVTHPLR